MEPRRWLRDYRIEKDMTQTRMAEYLGIAVTTYASYEQGYRTPKVVDAKEYAKKMDIDWKYFFDQQMTSAKMFRGRSKNYRDDEVVKIGAEAYHKIKIVDENDNLIAEITSNGIFTEDGYNVTIDKA